MVDILLVEDDKHQQLLYKEELEEEGYEVVLAGNGAEAMDRLREKIPDLIVLDICMPEMDGMEAMGEILGENDQIPIILHTAYSSYQDNFMSWAAKSYVIKSSDLTELKKEIRRILGEKAPSKPSAG